MAVARELCAYEVIHRKVTPLVKKTLLLAALGILILGFAPPALADPEISLLNVSYDPTRELWRDINASFIPRYDKANGVKLTINQSHGGSSKQAMSVAAHAKWSARRDRRFVA